jgi:acyl-CoA-binding protein
MIKEFVAAAEKVKKLKAKPSDQEMLGNLFSVQFNAHSSKISTLLYFSDIYGLYKQASVGDINTGKIAAYNY